ncbi:MAG: SDR family oxidoreductase [Actinobacteria bacterium]|nr:SDR family oxidoreductase [Actinomycetota bacterium]
MRERQVVVVTGASAGVGRAIAQAFAETGADVGLIARGEVTLKAAAAEIEATGGKAHAVVADVADAEAVERAADEIESALGPIDVWVNNAMTSVFCEFTEMTLEEFRRVTDVTYHGYVHGTHAALRYMLPRDRGVIVQIGSALAYRGIPLQSAYCGAKHAIEGFTESVRCELIHQGSNVALGIVQLPAVNTPQFDWVLSRLPRRAQPVPPIFQPELIAAAVVDFARRPRREMWLGWPTIRAILGNRVAPGLLDWYLGRTGYDAQQADEPERADRPSNLWSPVPGDWGAHGRFDECAITFSPAMLVSRYRRVVTAAAAGVVGVAGAAAALVRRD